MARQRQLRWRGDLRRRVGPGAAAAPRSRLPAAAVEGFTISAPIAEETLAPRGAVVDLERGFVLTRLGNRLRISGGAQLGHAAGGERSAKAGHYLITELLELFPGSIQRAESTLQH